MEIRNAHTIITGKPLAESPLGRPRSGSGDNIKMDIIEMGRENAK
jgi:hypothetical protein